MKTLLTILIALTIGANAGYNKIRCNGAIDSITLNSDLGKDNLLLGDKYMAKVHMGLVLKSITKFKAYCGNTPKVKKLYTEQRAEVLRVLKELN